jgi:hypothetical protein
MLIRHVRTDLYKKYNLSSKKNVRQVKINGEIYCFINIFLPPNLIVYFNVILIKISIESSLELDLGVMNL